MKAQESTGRMPVNSSFTKWMVLNTPTTIQLDSIVELSNTYLYRNQDTCQQLAERAVAISENLYPNQAIHAKALLQLGDACRVHDKASEGANYYAQSKAIYEDLGMESDVAHADSKLGTIAMNQGNYELSIEHHLKALKIWEVAKDTNNIFRPYFNIAEVFYYLGRKDKAYEYNLKALEIGRIKEAEAIIAIAIGNQGILEKELGEDYNRIADTISTNSQLYRDSAQIFFNKAMESNEFSLTESKKEQDKRGELEILENIIELKTATSNYAEAIKIGQEAEKVAIELGSNEHVLKIKAFVADAYRLFGQPKLAIFHGEIGLKLPETENRAREKSAIKKTLYKAYKELGEKAKALTYYEDYIDFEQNLKETQKVKAIAELEAKYQNAQKESQILEQKNDLLELTAMNTTIEKQRNFLFGGSLLLSIFGFLGIYFNKIRKERNDKIAFTEALIFAQEEERKRIARDLHDGIGQSLLLMKKQLVTTHEVTQANQDLIAETLEEVRSISQDLHPFQLGKFGLISAINEVIHKVEQSTDLFITKEMDNIDKLLDEKIEINLYRTIQEVLNNIVKHSEATAAKISIKRVDKSLIINIQDNGKGFDYELKVITSKSLGLRTMFERIAAIGGQLKIEKGVTKGTMILIRIPI